jgi:2'-5' RNA ligase
MSAPMLAFKGVAVDEGNESQIVDINEAEGIVTAVVSVTGTKDDVDDVIMPGAYADTLKARNPKVCWHHDWAKPIGRVLSIVELLPGDPRLPTKQRNGQPWPKEAGALVATMQFNMKSERGKEAFEAVVFYSETGECEWSIGYQVQAGKSHRDKQGVRWIKAIDLFELSFVLFGAHNMTGTLALKAAAMLMQMHTKGLTKTAANDTVVIRWEEFEQAVKALEQAANEGATDDEDTVAGVPVDNVDDTPNTTPPQPPADARPSETADGDMEDDYPVVVVDQLGDEAELVSDEEIEDETSQVQPAAKTLAAARLEIQRKSMPLEADTGIEDTCTCGDVVVFDTANGWMRKDGSYSHDDGTTHSDHLEPPDAAELAGVTVKSISSGDFRIDADGTLTIQTTEQKLLANLLTPLGEIKDTNPGDQSQGARELIHWYEHGEGAAKIRWGEDGDFMRCVHIAEKHMTTEQAKGFCSNRHLGALGVRPGQEKSFDARSDIDPLDTEPPDQMANEDEPEHTGVMVAVYPSEEAAKLIAVRGGEDPEELHVTLAYLGNITDEVGGGLKLGDCTPQMIAAAQIAGATYQPLSGSIGGLGKFPDSGDGVPIWAPVDVVGLSALREAVVTALTDAGLPVKTDHGFTPHMTLGWNLDMSLIPPVDDVSVTFDKLVVAVGSERTEVPLGGDPDIPTSGAPVAGAPELNPPLPGEEKAAGYNPAIETGPDAGYRPAVPTQRKSFPYLEGTYEERQRTLERELSEALLPEPEGDSRNIDAYLNIDGTWPDRVVCTVNNWAGPGPGDRQSYEVAYTVNPDGSITLGTPEKIRLSVVAVGEDGEDMEDVPVGDMLPLAEMVESVAGGIKTVTSGMEGKAGRVLSGANAQRLVSAVEHLISVLAAAGMEVGDPTERPATGTNPAIDTETTAPSARDGASKTLVAADVTATLADLTSALES